MNERINRSLSEDYTTVYIDNFNNAIPANSFAHLFNNRPPEIQLELAHSCIKRNIDPNLVISWITHNEIKNTFKVWCLGIGIQLKEERDNDEEAENTLSNYLFDNDEVIKNLSPHLSQIDLARIYAVKRYRTANLQTRQTLVCGVYRLLSEYLGPRRYYHREIQDSKLLPLPDLPTEIFSDNIISEILFESERNALVSIFNKNVTDGFNYLEETKSNLSNQSQILFIDKLIAYFENVQNFSVTGFKKNIPGSQKDVPESQRVEDFEYPAFHQKEYAYRFINKKTGKTDLLIGDTGTMKTGAAIYALEAAEAKSTLVVCPASLRLNWEREIQEKYEDHQQILKIESEAELRKLINTNNKIDPRYIILSYSLLSRLNPNDSHTLLNLLNKFDIDSLVTDEVHLAKEPSAFCTQQLYNVSRQLPETASRIAMTATGIVNSVEDLDAPVRILFPYTYQNQGDFTRAARNEPYLVSALLHGEKIMTRWSIEGILGNELPETNFRDEAVPLSPFHQSIYDYVYMDNTIESQVKRGMLRQVSLDPLLIRKYYHPDRINLMITKLQERQNLKQDDQEREIDNERIKSLQERQNNIKSLSNLEDAERDIKDAYQKFLELNFLQDTSECFDEDFLIKNGYDQLVLWSFFNLNKGMNEIIDKINDSHLKKDWQGKEEVYSSKYRRLNEILDELILTKKNKVIIYSGFYQSDVSSGIEDIENDNDLAFLSLYDHLRLWYGDQNVLKIDGSVSIEPKFGQLAEREKVRRAWRLEPSKKILLATIRSSRLGIDLTIPQTEENKDIKKTTIIFLDLPDTHADIDQGVGRVKRMGQKIPLDVIFLKTTNIAHPKTLRYGFIDHGMAESLEFKRLLSQMVLDGVPLTEEEEKFVKAHLSNLRIELYPFTPKKYLNEVFFRLVRGKSKKENQKFFNEIGFEGMTNADFFTTYYPLQDETSLPGHNAKVVSQVIKDYQKNSNKEKLVTASIGAGAGILQLNLGQPIINVDLLPEILQVAKSRLNNQGEYITGDASDLPIKSGSFDVTDVSFMLHWTSNRPIKYKNNTFLSERALVLQEINRVTKNDGLATITLPSSYLTEQQFVEWKDTLEKYFGFSLIDNTPSGLVIATDYKREKISWMFNLKKIAEPSLGFSANSLKFDFEKTVEIIDKRQHKQNLTDESIVLSQSSFQHVEFEIVQPESTKTQKLTYQYPISETDIEQILSQDKNSFSTGIEILTQLGIEEFGLFRRLSKEAKRRWELNTSQAETLALNVLSEWTNNGSQKYNVKKIWSELKNLMALTFEKRNYGESGAF